MKFNIRDIGINGREVVRDLDYQHIHSMLAQVGVELATEDATVHLEFNLSPIEKAISVSGTLLAHFNVSCGRCLGPAPIRVEEHHLKVTFLPALSKEEADLYIEDVDTFTHDGEVLDLEPMVRELLVLSIPLAPLCDPECKGISISGMKDLHQENGECDDQQLKLTPWAAELHRLKKQHN